MFGRLRRRARAWAAVALRAVARACGYRIDSASNHYSPLPDVADLARTRRQWERPSRLPGVCIDADAMWDRLGSLCDRYAAELAGLPSYDAMAECGFGPGCPEADVLLLYMMLRETKPPRYHEVGSGLSTAYARLAADRNAAEGAPCRLTCIEPYPRPLLRDVADEVIQAPAEHAPSETYLALEETDVLFLDSTHVLRLGGEVAYLYTEILPALSSGVRVHIHDIPLPHLHPYPAAFWTVSQLRPWPMLWTEPYLVAAMLQHATGPGQAWRIEMSAPYLRHLDAERLQALLPACRPVDAAPNAFSSLWLVRQ